MAYIRKTEDLWIIETNYGFGHGREEVIAYSTRKDAIRGIKEYRQNMPEYPYYLRKKRVKI